MYSELYIQHGVQRMVRSPRVSARLETSPLPMAFVTLPFLACSRDLASAATLASALGSLAGLGPDSGVALGGSPEGSIPISSIAAFPLDHDTRRLGHDVRTLRFGPCVRDSDDLPRKEVVQRGYVDSVSPIEVSHGWMFTQS